MQNKGPSEEKKGWLTKQGGFVKSWKLRWFVLRDSTLYYYKNEKATEPAGSLPIQNAVISQAAAKLGKKNSFEVKTADRILFLLAESPQEMNDWISALSKTAKPTEGITADTDNLKTMIFSVKGMMCERCAEKLKHSTYKLSGVTSVELNFDAERITVTAKCDALDILTHIEDAGYVTQLVS